MTGARAAAIVRECRATNNHFVCHKGSAAGLIVHCRGMHDIQPGRAYIFAERFRIPIREVDPDALEKVT